MTLYPSILGLCNDFIIVCLFCVCARKPCIEVLLLQNQTSQLNSVPSGIDALSPATCRGQYSPSALDLSRSHTITLHFNAPVMHHSSNKQLPHIHFLFLFSCSNILERITRPIDSSLRSDQLCSGDRGAVSVQKPLL